MVGIPGETAQSILRTIAFNIKVNPDEIQYTIFQPYPGTLSYQECLDKGYLTRDIASVKDMFSESIISTEDLRPRDAEHLFLLARLICRHRAVYGLLNRLDTKTVMLLLNLAYHSRILDLLWPIKILYGKIKNWFDRRMNVR